MEDKSILSDRIENSKTNISNKRTILIRYLGFVKPKREVSICRFRGVL